MLLFIVFRNFLYFAKSRGSFDAIAFLLAASRSRMPFFNACLRHTMTTERLSDLPVIAMHAKAVTIDRSVVCEKFVALHPRQMTASSLLAD